MSQVDWNRWLAKAKAVRQKAVQATLKALKFKTLKNKFMLEKKSTWANTCSLNQIQRDKKSNDITSVCDGTTLTLVEAESTVSVEDKKSQKSKEIALDELVGSKMYKIVDK